MMRIKGIGVARIRTPEMVYALRVCTQPEGNGPLILQPFTRVLEFEPDGLSNLWDMGAREIGGNINDSDPNHGVDLDCEIPDAKFAAAMKWFASRKGRTVSVLSATLDTLTRWSILDRSDHEGTAERFVRSSYMDVKSTRSGGLTASPQARYLIDLFDVLLHKEAMNRLIAATKLKGPQKQIHLVTKDELRKGVTQEGILMAQMARALL